jgi:hypothetical protein
VKGGVNDIHAHLVDSHTDLVVTEVDAETGKMRYIISCPFCPLKYQHAIKPRYRDPAFLEEFKREIALVAFDQFLYHVAKDHGPEIGFDPSLLDPEPEE